MSEITNWSAVQTAAAIASKDVSVANVVRAHLDRVDAIEPHLRAVVDVFDDRAMAEARAMDQNRPDVLPPLWGLPTTVKINTDLAGSPNSNGLPALNQTPAPDDAPVVANLKNAGAVIIGRTSTPEFSLRFFTSNPIYGQTLNPWDGAITSGGSSGGASAAIAAGAGVLAHGNDLGGSLRYPAYCCGLATLRPSIGRVPAFNHTAPAERAASLQMMSVQGVIARQIGDIWLAYGPISQRSSLDPLWSGARDSGRSRDGRALRVGVASDPFGDGEVSADVVAAVEAAAGAARGAGFEVVPVDPPMMMEAAEAWGQILNAEISATMLESIREYGSPEVNGVIDGYAELFGTPDLAGFMAQQAVRLTAQRAWAQMFDGIDALIMPVSLQPPFRAEQDILEPETLAQIMQAQRSLYVINLLGLPAATVRTTDHRPVPLGVQIVGDRMDDLICLDVAEAIEKELSLDLGPIDPRV